MDARAVLRQRIHDELRHHPWEVAQRLLTKAFEGFPELDAPSRHALRQELDAAIDAADPPPPMAVAAPAPTPPARTRGPDPARIDEIIADALHAPTDGSAARFEVLAQRARQQLERELAGQGVGWWTAWRLRRRLEAGLCAQRASLVRPRP